MPHFEFLVVPLILLASVWLWGAAIRRWRAGQPLVPMSAAGPVPWGLLDLALAVGCWLILMLAADLFRRAVVSTGPQGEPDTLVPATQIPLLLIGSVAMLLVCLATSVFLWVRHGTTLRELGWDRRHLAGDVLLGAQAFAMLAPFVYGIQILITQFIKSEHPLLELLKQHPDPRLFAVVAFAAVIAAPITEEFLYRVLLQGWLERSFAGNCERAEALVLGGRPTSQSQNQPVVASPQQGELPGELADKPQPRPAAILLSSFLFALSHLSHGPDPIPLFVFALGLGYLYQRTHRIVPCIVLHFLLNACSLTALWLLV